MTTIDTLLTLDADDPALRRGIAALLGEKADFGFVNHRLGGFQVTVPDWTHSVDAALGLCSEDTHIWRVELTLWPGKMARADIWMKPPLDLDAPSDFYATMGGNEGEPKSLALAICRAWLASKR